MKYSLFIGRYQPLHEGHIKLIRSVLDEGKNVLVAIRDTSIDEENPYSLMDRRKMFRKEFEKELKERRMKIRRIPDIEEVCYGRKVGWGIREIRLDETTESISGSEIRKCGEK